MYGKHFPCTQCTVTGTGDGWGFVSQGPWTGDIVTGIAIQTPCDNSLGGQSFQIQVACTSDPSVSVTQTINC